jgi:hypothetical protein
MAMLAFILVLHALVTHVTIRPVDWWWAACTCWHPQWQDDVSTLGGGVAGGECGWFNNKAKENNRGVISVGFHFYFHYRSSRF